MDSPSDETTTRPANGTRPVSNIGTDLGLRNPGPIGTLNRLPVEASA